MNEDHEDDVVRGFAEDRLAETARNEAEQFRRLAEDAREVRDHHREALEAIRQERERLRETAETARIACEEAGSLGRGENDLRSDARMRRHYADDRDRAVAGVIGTHVRRVHLHPADP